MSENRVEVGEERRIGRRVDFLFLTIPHYIKSLARNTFHRSIISKAHRHKSGIFFERIAHKIRQAQSKG